MPVYTIDTSSLLEIFREDRAYPKNVFVNLWQNLEIMFKNEKIISHEMVYEEIQKGIKKDEITDWSNKNKNIFKPIDLDNEPKALRSIEAQSEFKGFINDQSKRVSQADFWLIAQAKVLNLEVITQENKHSSVKLAYVCRKLGIKTLSLLDFIKENKWKF